MTGPAVSTRSLQQVHIDDTFWSPYVILVRETVIPYQWKALNDQIPDAEPSYAIYNFQVAADVKGGQFGGMVFQDSDVAKWLEAVAYTLAAHRDPELEALADQTIDLIVNAQQADGYLNTYFTIQEPSKRWTNVYECHELYCAGHMIEAAVAYYEVIGKRKLLDAMCRFADYIDSVFGPEPDQIHGYPGHQEIELALVKLYQATGEPRYLKLGEYFINERGKSPNYFIAEWQARGGQSHWPNGPTGKLDLKYNQSHVPVREQDVAVGHAVRAVYMYTAMADLARLTGDQALYTACQRLWKNITSKQMYIHGGIGSTHHGEAFSFDYDLPNDTIYAETCASIGLVFFAQRMLQMETKSEYADVIERILYNLVIGSMTLDGTSYFYVNPLEVVPEASVKNPDKHHVKVQRQKWFGCSCCPPNLARLISSLGRYVYTANQNTIFTHLFIGSEVSVELQGEFVRLRQRTAMPRQGHVELKLFLNAPKHFTLALRIPSWSNGEASLRINGEPFPIQEHVEAGYVRVERMWRDLDTVEWILPMTPQLVQANPQVRDNAGKVALVRGPLVYCLEELDNGSNLSALSLEADGHIEEVFNPKQFGGFFELHARGRRDDASSFGDTLYRPLCELSQKVTIRAIPYYLWGNREPGEMAVWIRKNRSDA